MRTKTGVRTPITSTKEDYVRAIYLLHKSAGEVGVTDIAKRLKLSKSTVSERIKELVRDGLATAAPYAPVELTAKGQAIGKKLTYKHRLIEVFLHETLKMRKDQVHIEAERLEHAFSDEAIEHLDRFLKHPTHDPHGSPISH
jgi:DtxR family transcriptional regulator, Mn-dependent transcriptional regulator